MGDNAVAGIGTKLYYGDGDSDETFTAFAEIDSVEVSGIKRDTIETTDLDTDWRTFMKGLRDGGEIPFQGNFFNSQWDTIMSQFNEQELRNYQIVLPDTAGTTWTFAGMFSSIRVTGMSPNNEKIAVAAVLKVSGVFTTEA